MFYHFGNINRSVIFQNTWLDSQVGDCGALINVDVPGCGTWVVRGLMGHK